MHTFSSSRTTTALIWILIIGCALALIVLISKARLLPTLLEKKKIKTDISTAISNGADLKAVRQIYNNRRPVTKFTLFTSTQDEYYKYLVPLSELLQDIRVGVFLTEKKDEQLLAGLERIILEHFEIDPFDKLEITQRDYFANIRMRSKDTYNMIKNDLDKIADELYNKNLLVSKYLNTSETSFWVSVLGLSFSLLIGTVTFFQNRRQRLVKLLAPEIVKAIGEEQRMKNIYRGSGLNPSPLTKTQTDKP